MATPAPVKKVFKIRMSRGETDDSDIDLERVEDYVLFDERENAIRFGEIYKMKKTIFIFLRHPQCFTVKEYMDDLCRVSTEMLEEVNVQLAIILPSKSETAFTFRTEFMLGHSVYCDPEMALYKELGFTLVTSTGETLASSKHVKSGWVSGVLQSTYRAMWYQDFSADMYQNGGCLVAGPGRLLHFFHRDKCLFDQVSINKVLEFVGAGVISFPKDARVITV
ncbi:hypothetical protein BOX15_Mlig031782g1 [Macrostomum lignano]|uniref:Uncharacterized protein n=2 Tax=Macrostomum lignano TaxID=282301 RepID=A0A267DSG1_9PLAT|nr:hypothetical protein BOX15_Mlig011941g1 [Macrostomum lignano]PAA76439.1 hypothetical protein BOX15_Mlig031782g1 [Macrostomum lignano]